jgi:ABC-type multidrug transport system ATPase subunit
MTFVLRHDEIRRGRRIVLRAGEITAALPAAVAVVGANGSGKTSLFMHVTRTLARQRTAATMRLRGEPVRTIGYVSQSFPLPPWLCAAHAAPLFGCDFDDLCARMPGLLLDELRSERVERLSPGQRQALSFAFALGTDARMLVLDEPFASMDLPRRVGALALLRAWLHRSDDRAVLLSSQHAGDLLEVCDHFVVLRSGRYVFNGSRTALTDGIVGDATRAESQLLALMTR